MRSKGLEIDVTQVRVVFAGRAVLDDVTLKVDAGERVALLGPSGAGKTTLLRVIVAAVRPYGGQVRIDGSDPFGRRADVTRLRRAIGCVRQRHDLVPGLTARTNILAGAAHQWRMGDWVSILSGGVPRRFADRLGELARRHEIEHTLSKRVQYLSGGESQRVALARALFTRPRLLLADECTSDLDPVRAAVVLEHLRNSGATLVATTHDLNVARYCDRVVALREGKIVYDGPPPDSEEIERIYGKVDPAEMVL